MAGAAVRFTRIGGFLAGRVMLRHRPCRFLSNGSGSRTERTNYDHERKLKAKSEATRDSRAETSVLQSLMETDTTQSGELTTAQKVVERGKDVSYFVVICIGFGVTGFLLWVILSEFFSSGSPSSVFKRALKKVKANEKVRSVIGEDITGYGDWSGRGRRRRISHQPYVVGDTNYVRVQFYISGSQRKATVQAEMQAVSRGRWEFRFLFVELEGYPPGVIVIEDNR